MKSIGYALLFAGLVGGGIFMMNLMTQLAEEQCARNCPNDKNGLVMKIDLGFARYKECSCK